MIRRKLVQALITIMLTVVAADKPNISGTWELDKNRSFSNPAGLDQTMTIVHTGDEVKLDAKLVIQGKETIVNETWTLDGREYEFTPVNAPAIKGKRVAAWLPGNRGILVTDVTTITTPDGPGKQQTTRKYTLSTDGGSLIVDYYTDRPGFSFEAKRVFVRK
jgi:hypothetical protein